MKKILHGNLACLADYGPPNERAQQFMAVGRSPMKSFLESILLFDQIVIPTNDYMPLSLLIGILGEATVRQLLDDDVLKFARFDQSIAYAGGGVGVTLLMIYNPDGETPKYFSAPSDEAIRLAVDATVAKNKRQLSRLALQATQEFAIQTEEHGFAQAVYKELGQNLSWLSHPFYADLKKLPGVTDRDVRGLSGIWAPGQDDDVFQMLRVAQACMEARAASVSDCDDVYTADQVSKLYEKGFSRIAQGTERGNQYSGLREIAGLPDVAELALTDKSHLPKILKLRNSSDGAAFRSWFHAHCAGDPRNTAKEYASLLKEIPAVQSAPARAFRYFVGAGVGVALLPADPLLGLGAGLAVSAVDNFLVDRMLRGRSPKIFIERLADIAKVPKNSH